MKNILDNYTIRDLLERSEKLYGPQLALSNVDNSEETLTYTALKRRVDALATFLIDKGVEKGEHVALLGESQVNWAVAYLAIVSAGCIALPLLPDFSAREVGEIFDHSGVRVAVVASKHFPKIGDFKGQAENIVIRLEDLFYIPQAVAKELTGDKEFKGGAGIDTLKTKVDLEKVALRKSQEDELASIIYTSGTTGEPKGVMLSNKNLTSNAAASVRQFFRVRKGMQFLSILPLAHTYEFTIGFLLPLLCGCHIHYLNRPPSPSVLLPAMKRVRPHVMLSVPLLIERIYKNSVLAKIEKSERLSKLYKRPLFRVFINRMVGRQLRSTFGGRLKFFGVGGAPLEYECEKFLKEARFPYAIGYGLTETSPLLAGAGPKQTKVGTIGYPLKGVSLKMGEDGEILAKGPNVMVGYYNQEELTQDSFTADGWFKTGDLGEMDKGRLTIKGRSKTMILGPSGENIYPELIEQLLNNQPYVEESLVIEGEEGLVAMIKINFELMGEHLKMSLADAKESASAYLNKLRKDVNWQLSSHSHIRVVELQEEPFKRTPTLKIKRYLYALRGGIKE